MASPYLEFIQARMKSREAQQEGLWINDGFIYEPPVPNYGRHRSTFRRMMVAMTIGAVLGTAALLAALWAVANV